MSSSASSQLIKQALNSVGDLSMQYPETVKISTQPDILLRSQMDKLKGHFSTGQVQPLNFRSGYFLSSNVGQYIDFNITNLDLDVIQDIYVVMNATNMSTTVATIPLPATHWIQQYSIYQGPNQWENNVPNDVILLKTLLNNDDTKLESLASLELFDASTGQHDSGGIAVLATANYYVKMPPCTLTNLFIFLPSLSQPPRLRLYMNGGNFMYTTSAQTLQLNSIYLKVHGLKYSDEVRQSLLSIYRQGNFVNKCSVYQLQVYNIGTSLASLSTQIQQILLSFQGQASSILFWIRPSTLGGSTDYGLAQLEENVELAQIISLTGDKGQNARSQNMPARISSEIFVNKFYPGLFLSNLIYLLPFSLQPRQSTHNGSDIGYLNMNGNNVLTNISCWGKWTIQSSGNC